jgi:hypothetical protein
LTDYDAKPDENDADAVPAPADTRAEVAFSPDLLESCRSSSLTREMR